MAVDWVRVHEFYPDKKFICRSIIFHWIMLIFSTEMYEFIADSNTKKRSPSGAHAVSKT